MNIRLLIILQRIPHTKYPSTILLIKNTRSYDERVINCKMIVCDMLQGSYTELVVALLTSVTKNWQTLLEFSRTLPPEGEVPTTTATDDGRVPTAASPATTDNEATTATIATPPPQRLCQHHTRLTPAQKDEVITLYQQGVPVREICQRYGISRQQVSDLRNARGIPRRPRGLSDEQKRQAEQHYLAGQSCATIGRQFGVHAETVRRYLRTAGVALRPRPGTA